MATATKGVDVVFHLAGLIKALNYDELLRVNEQGSRNVAKRAPTRASRRS